MDKWAYRVLTLKKKFFSAEDKNDPEKMLNDLGKEGWELVSVIPLSTTSGSTTGMQLFLKKKDVF
ncbi:MAG: DUF4177 domain-containing protein [archaeon]|nr:MAG: DUF4177 domain-containing protein [archaeon]